MLFEETFLEKSEYQKFQMFRILKSFEGTNYTIIDIANKMKTSYQQTYNILQELLEDTQTFPNVNNTKLSRKKALSNKKIPITIDMYRMFLLKKSIVFEFVNYIFQGNNPNVEKFCQDHYISRSTLIRKNSALKSLLAKVNIKISYNNLGFIGDEKSIRFFLYCFYWMSYRGIEWPFKHVQYYDVAKQLKLNKSELNDPISTIRTILFWTISRIRVIHGFYINDMDRFDEIFPDNFKIFETTESFNLTNFPNVTQDQLIIENKFFNFFRLQTLLFPITDDEISNVIYTIIKKEQNPVWKLTQKLVNELETHLLSKTDVKLISESVPLEANIMRIFFSYYIMDGNYLQFNDFYSDNNYNNEVLINIVNSFTTKESNEPEFAPYLLVPEKVNTQIQYLLIPYLGYFKANENVKVKLILENSDLLTRDMMMFLNDLSFVKLASEGDSPNDADVIITSLDDLDKLYNFEDLDDKVIIKWNLNATELEYFNLYQTIKQEFTKKITQ